MRMERYQRIRNLREDSDLTQQQVGEAINVPQRTYAYYESGQRMIPCPVRAGGLLHGERELPFGADGQEKLK